MANKPKIPVKAFNEWQAEEVEKTFGVTRLKTLPLMDELLAIQAKKEHHSHHTTIESYRKDADWRVEGWNTDEYKFLFIAPFLRLVNFTNVDFSVFTQRPMSVFYENNTKQASGNVDFMLARGRQIPKEPRFFLHQYKPEKHRDNDPLGQLLIAMVSSQQLNKDEKPVYGIYINQQNWFFVVLDGNKYAISRAYAIATNAIFDLFAALEFLREKMIEMYKPSIIAIGN